MTSSKPKPTSKNSSTPHPTMTSHSLLKQAIEFRQIMGQEIGTSDDTVISRQLRLITEEFKEFNDATDYEPDANQLKELADLVYVCFQYAVARGWELDEALDRVHESNLSKLVDGKPLRREDGKVLKGPAYAHPYLDDLV